MWQDHRLKCTIFSRSYSRSHNARLDWVRKNSSSITTAVSLITLRPHLLAISVTASVPYDSLGHPTGIFTHHVVDCRVHIILLTGTRPSYSQSSWRSIHGLCLVGSHVKLQQTWSYVPPWSFSCVRVVQVSKSTLIALRSRIVTTCMKHIFAPFSSFSTDTVLNIMTLWTINTGVVTALLSIIILIAVSIFTPPLCS
jgi:hypothetical protein